MGLARVTFVLLFFLIFTLVNAESPASSTSIVEFNSIFDKKIRLPDGFNYKVISGSSTHPVRRPDMNVLSPDGKFIFTSHEIFDKKISASSPSLTKTELSTGKTTTLITGLHAADGLKWTPWNTLLLGQEYTEGYVYEVNPENGTHIKRPRLGMFAHEGFAITGNGNIYMTDDERQGAIYKFIPNQPVTPDSLGSGTLYALSKTGWIKIDNSENARQESRDNKAIMFKKPEDMEVGPDGKIYVAISAENRVISIDDTGRKPVITDYISTDTGILYPDNLVFHPNGELYILEDIPEYLQYLKMRTNNIWIAEPDRNNDHYSDNIKPFASWAPISSEPSGAIFSHDGHTMYINRLEHNNDITGAIIEITGFNK